MSHMTSGPRGTGFDVVATDSKHASYPAMNQRRMHSLLRTDSVQVTVGHNQEVDAMWLLAFRSRERGTGTDQQPH